MSDPANATRPNTPASYASNAIHQSAPPSRDHRTRRFQSCAVAASPCAASAAGATFSAGRRTWRHPRLRTPPSPPATRTRRLRTGASPRRVLFGCSPASSPESVLSASGSPNSSTPPARETACASRASIPGALAMRDARNRRRTQGPRHPPGQPRGASPHFLDRHIAPCRHPPFTGHSVGCQRDRTTNPVGSDDTYQRP